MRLTGRFVGLLIGAALVVPSGITVAQQQSVADGIKARQQHFKDIADSVKTISEQLKTGMPDKAVVVQATMKISALAHDQLNWFPKGSGPEAGVKTRAKPEIWANWDDFKMKHDALVVEADKWVKVAQTGDAA